MGEPDDLATCGTSMEGVGTAGDLPLLVDRVLGDGCLLVPRRLGDTFLLISLMALISLLLSTGSA